jgi:Flp pilus assembly protein TadD
LIKYYIFVGEIQKLLIYKSAPMKKIYVSVIKVVLLTLIVLSPTVFYGQKAQKPSARSQFDPYWYVGANAGLSLLHGDITKYRVMPDGDHIKFGFSGLFGRQLTPFFGVRGQLGYGKYAGVEDRAEYSYFTEIYNQEVSGDWIDYSLQATFDLDRLIMGYNPDRFLGVYAFLGIGNTQYRVEKTDLNTNSVVKRGYDETNGEGGKGFASRRVVGMVPAGLGINLRLAEKWDMNIESSVRFTDTEGMDIVSGGAKEIKNDFYSYTSLGFTYKFGAGSNIKKMQRDYGLVKYTVEPEVLEAHGDSIPVVIRGVFPPKYFNKKAAMYFQPVVKYGDKEMKLKPIMLRGEQVQGDGDVINYNNGGSFTYKTTIPYSPELNVCEVHVAPIVFTPKKDPVSAKMNPEEISTRYKTLSLDDRKLADGVIYTCKKIVADQITSTSAHGYQSVVVLTKNSNIYYPKNKEKVDLKFGLNKDKANGEARAQLFDYISKGYKVKDITISAWASPEGEETFNENLSGKRGESAKKAVLADLNKMKKDLAKAKNTTITIGDPAKDYTWNVTGNGPDWNGFMKAIEASNIKEKSTILNVVNSADPSKKEQEIRNMIVIYPEIEKDILPPLRRSEIAVNAFEPKRTNEEIAQLATTDPSKLTKEELLFAATLTQDAKAQAAIYRSAAANFPDCWKANNNAGVAEMKLNNLEKAESYLNKANQLSPDNGEVINNLGVLYAKRGDLNKANTNFEKAKKLGINEGYNLATIMITKGKYSEALPGLKDQKCSYNLALAQMLAKNNGDAARTLECAPKDAHVYYLSAVLGARTNNTTMLYENLQKAVKENASLKSSAKTDREFAKYFDLPEFRKIVE